MIAWLVPPPRREEVRADLLEVCELEAQRRGPWAARRRYWNEVLGLLRWRWRRLPRREHPPDAFRMHGLLHDLRYGTRALVRRPTTSGLAIVTLAVGIGLSTAMFSLVEAVVLRPLRLPEPERVVRLTYTGETNRFGHYLSGPDFEQLRESVTRAVGPGSSRPFVDLAAVGAWLPTLVTDQGGRRIWAGRVSPWFFRMLGISPLLGRDFVADDVTGAETEAVILGYRIWQSAFGADVDIIGRRIDMSPHTYTVIGILPPDIDLPTDHELWTVLDLTSASWMRDRGVRPFLVYGRVSGDATLGRARDLVGQVATRIARAHPDTNAGVDVDIVPLRSTLAENVRRPLLILLGAVLMVLLIACANVTNLLLASGVTRSEEFAICLALGCPRGRLVRRVLVEALLLSGVAGTLGVLTTIAAVDAIRAIASDSVPRLEGLAINAAVLGFALIAALASALVAGLIPALRATAGERHAGRSLGGRSGSGRRHPGEALLIGEFALCAVLLVGAGLFLRSLGHLDRVDLGLEYAGVQSLRTSVGSGRDPVATIDEIRSSLQRLVGVERVVATSHIPLSGAYMDVPVILRDRPVRDVDRPLVTYRVISPGYFEALGIGLVRGRTIHGRDGADSRRVAVVNEAAAKRLWGDADPVGQILALADRPEDDTSAGWIEVVGVVADVRHGGPGSPPMPAFYVSYSQADQAWRWGIGGSMGFLVWPTAGVSISEARLRQAVREVSAEIPVFAVTTLASYLRSSTAQTRFAATLLQIFSGVAFLLAAVGIYGLVSFAVRRRTHDIGIRMALGADRFRVQKEILGGALRIASAGAVAGLVLVQLVGRAIASQLHGVTTSDLSTNLTTVLALVSVALVASWVPARHAAALDPSQALRAE